MTTAYSTKGRTVGLAVQTSLTNEPAAGAHGEIHLEEPVTTPTDEKMVVAQPNIGHTNAYDWSDQPVTYEGVRTDAVTLPLTFRQGASAGAQSPLSTVAESGGCLVTVMEDDVLTNGTDGANFDIVAAHVGTELGVCLAVELPDGRFYPTLLNSYTTGSGACVAQMALPATPEADDTVQATETIIPQTGQVDAAKLLSLLTLTRGAHTGTEDLSWYHRACALSSFGEIVIEPGQAEGGIIKINPTFHTAKVEQAATALTSETFLDHDKISHTSNNLVCEFGDYLAAGEIVHSNIELLRATITPNHTTAVIPGTGSTSTLNDAQGYMAQMLEQPQVVLEVLMDKAYWTDFKLATQTEKHIGFVMPSTSVDSVAWGIWLPRCYQIASPVADLHGSEYIKATLTYAATNAGISPNTNNASGQSPWYIGIMQR